MNESESEGSDQDSESQDFGPITRRRLLERTRQAALNELDQFHQVSNELRHELVGNHPLEDLPNDVESLSSDSEENLINAVVEILSGSDRSDTESRDSLEAPNMPDAPGLPDTRQLPDAQDPPGAPGAPEQPDAPRAQETPTVERVEGPLVIPDAERPSTSNRAQREQEQHQPNESVVILDSPSQPNKRKRLCEMASEVIGTPVAKANDDEIDDGMTCPICLEPWEMSGDHRLVSLRCGHLFGDACIRRWLVESQRQSSVRVCPQCKTKANTRDIRCLYAKRLRAIDRTEEHDMRRDLESERRCVQALKTELATIKMEHSVTKSNLKSLQIEYDRMRTLLRAGVGRNIIDDNGRVTDFSKLATHRLHMEKNFEISRDPGCRVMIYSSMRSILVASQKSSQQLFPGFGMRFIDPTSFKPMSFMHTSGMLIRDVAFSESQQMLSVASRETRIKTFDPRMRNCCASVSANDRPLWSCGVDRDAREHFLYAGDLRGAVYIFDVRFPNIVLSEFQSYENFSPVINIAAVPAGNTFQDGGFLVCQLTALKFYEYVHDTAVPTRLNVDGPFLSMQYDAVQDTVLISSRSNDKYPQSRFIFGKLLKVEGVPVINIIITVLGSPATPYMTRPTQLGVADNTLIVGYLQDSKQLMMYDVKREERVQTMPVNEVVYDICPVNTSAGSYLAALNDSKCRIYKVNSSSQN